MPITTVAVADEHSGDEVVSSARDDALARGPSGGAGAQQTDPQADL